MQQQGPPLTQAAVPWIDVHLHLIGGRGPQADYAGAADAAIRDMDRVGMAMAIVMSPPQVDAQAADVSVLASAVARHRGRFALLGGGGALNPMIHQYADPARVTDAVKQEFVAAAEQIIDSGAVGFGEMASLHISAGPGHPYEFVPADHPLFRALADVAAKRDVPIDLHMDAVDAEMPTPSRFAAQSANPPKLPETMSALARLLAYNPKARIVWAHGGSDPLGGMTAAAIGKLMDAHANLFVSLRIVGAQAPVTNKALSGSGLDPEWSDLLVRHADRFVIGTDSFMVSPSMRGSGPGITFAQGNDPKLRATVHFLSLLPSDVANKIGRENAIRIYKLPAK